MNYNIVNSTLVMAMFVLLSLLCSKSTLFLAVVVICFRSTSINKLFIYVSLTFCNYFTIIFVYISDVQYMIYRILVLSFAITVYCNIFYTNCCYSL